MSSSINKTHQQLQHIEDLYLFSPISSMIGNFFIRISKPLVPTKIFTDEAKAKEWLKQFVKAQ